MKPSARFLLEKEHISLATPCTRFQRYPKEVNEERAVVYLELRKGGCNKKSAIKYTAKTHCRTDVTRAREGPLNHKVLKVKKSRNPVSVHGWSIEPAKFDLGPKRYVSPADFLNNDAQSLYFEEQFGKQEQKIREDYKKKLAQLRDYFEEISVKCNFKHLTKEELYRKLKRENLELKKEKAQRNADIMTLQSLGLIPEGRPTGDTARLDLIESYYGGANADNSPMSVVKKSFHHKLTSKPTLEMSPRFADDYKVLSPGFSEVKRGMMIKDYGSSNKIVETFKSMEESRGEDESEHFSRYKAYEELETQMKMLYDMTNEDPKEFSSNYISGKKLTSSPTRIISTLNKIEDEPPEPKKMVLKNDELINEFNKLNYFYLHHEEAEDSAAPSPMRKIRADEQSKHRKQQQILEQDMFEKIFEFETQKTPEIHRPYDSTNLEKMIAQKESIKRAYQKKISRKPDLHLNLGALTTTNFSHSQMSTVHSARTDKQSHSMTRREPPGNSTFRAVTFTKTKEDEIKDTNQSKVVAPPIGRILKTSMAHLKIIVNKQANPEMGNHRAGRRLLVPGSQTTRT